MNDSLRRTPICPAATLKAGHPPIVPNYIVEIVAITAALILTIIPIVAYFFPDLP